MGSGSPSTAKLLIVVIIVAVIAAVVATLLQVLIIGRANAAVTGGAVGAITAGLAVTIWKKKTSAT